MRDLVLLVADKDMEMTIHGLLSRPFALGIRTVEYDVFTHPRHDPGVRMEAADFLRAYQSEYGHAVVLFDRIGCGAEDLSAEDLENVVRDSIQKTGWYQRCEVVVIDPELEVWVFAQSPHVYQVLAGGDEEYFRISLSKYPAAANGKPERPKELMEQILRGKNIPRSSALYLKLAERVSLSRCSDRAFLRFRETLQRWFGVEEEQI
ncbi:MAG: methylation-associated defense system protein MAD4 [Armatimonadota bacterium]